MKLPRFLSNQRFWRVVVVIIAVELIAAAIWKALDPGFFLFGMRGLFGSGFYPPYWTLGAVIALEFGLAAWLVSGLRHTTAITTTALLFIGSTAYHAFAISKGYSHTCSCFGKMWSALGIRPHGIVDTSLAAAPMILLIAARGVIDKARARVSNIDESRKP